MKTNTAGPRETVGILLALVLAVLTAFGVMLAQYTAAASVPIDLQGNTSSTLALVGVADTAVVTYSNNIGVLFPATQGIIANADSVYKYHNSNQEWQVTVSALTGRGTGMVMVKLTREVRSPGGFSRDTLWVRANNVYTKHAWDNSLDIIVSSSADVGAQSTIYFRTLQPLKVNSSGLLQIDVAKPDSFHTY